MSDQEILDRAFDSFARDLAHAPSPGATAAVATARRRRRTTLASVGALTVLVVGAAALPQLVGDAGREGGLDVASSTDPVAFSGSELTRAVAGWTGPWREPDRGDDLEEVGFGEPRCLDELPAAGSNVEPRRVGDAILVSDSAGTGAFASFAEFGSADEAAPVLDLFAPAAIESACGVATDDVTLDGTEVRHAHVGPTDGEPGADWWLAVDGSRLAMLVVASPDAAPADVQGRVATLLARALDAEVNFESSATSIDFGSSGSSSGGTTGRGDVPSYRALTRAAIMEVTDGWPAAISTPGQLSCTARFSLAGEEWQSMSSDDQGTTTTHAGLADEAGARRAVDQVTAQLESCVQSDWRVTTGTLRGGRTLSADSSQGTLVLAQRGSTLAWVTIGEADAPPAAVQAITSLLHDTLVVGEETPKP